MNKETGEIVDRVLKFTEALIGFSLYPYERQFATRVIESVAINDGEEISALFSRQSGKCLGKGTPILMYDGSIKKVEEVKVGDLIMGDDSTKRKVLSVCSGREEMYEVKPRSGYAEPFRVNKSHILSIIYRGKGKKDISVRDYLKLKSWEKKDGVVAYKVGVDYPTKNQLVDPYWLGLWLGDGKHDDVMITNTDIEVISYLTRYAGKLGMTCKEYLSDTRCSSWAITSENNGWKKGKRQLNILREFVKSLRFNKVIPQEYLCGDYSQRMELLAGLIDSDGHRPKGDGKESVGEITLKDYNLANQVHTLIRSLGIRCSMKERIARVNDYSCKVYRLNFYGELYRIPTKIVRKQWKKTVLRENPLTFGFDLIGQDVDEYYGFEIDGNKRFVLGDFTVTHNTETIGSVMSGIAIAFPFMAKLPQYQNMELIQRFRDGILIGIFAPIMEQAQTTFDRMRGRLGSKSAKQIMEIPQIGVGFETNNGNCIALSNGSEVLCMSASDNSHIESKTFHLIVMEECQEISNSKIRKSIHPMGAATNATLVKVGTAYTRRNDFFDAIQRNKKKFQIEGIRNHFEYDYNVACKYNPRYAKYIEKEKYRLHEDSDEFRMSYGLEWILERGMFVTPELLEELGLDYDVQDYYRDAPLCAGIDFAKERDSTVVTVIEPNYNEVSHDGCMGKRIVDWLEIYGDDYETQFYQIRDYLNRFSVEKICTDSTGVGDPITDRIIANFADVQVIPVKFSRSSCSDIYKYLLNDFNGRRIYYPNSIKAKKLLRQRKFVQQFMDLEKYYEGEYMVCDHPDEKDSHNDYTDSLALAVWASRQEGVPTMEVGGGLF